MKVIDLAKVIRVPVDYLIKEGDKRYVMVLPEKPTPTDLGKKTEVKTGAESASFIQILSGLKEGVSLKRPPYNGPNRDGSSITVEG